MKNIIIIVFSLVILIYASCKPAYNTSYSVKPIYSSGGNSALTGNEGTVLLEITSSGSKVNEAIERAKIDAIHAVLVKGIPGSNSSRPILKSENQLHENKEYFIDFFGVDDLRKRTYKRKGYGNKYAPYRNFVNDANDGSVIDRKKRGNEIFVTIALSVNYRQLRKKLEDDGIVKKFGIN